MDWFSLGVHDILFPPHPPTAVWQEGLSVTVKAPIRACGTEQGSRFHWLTLVWNIEVRHHQQEVVPPAVRGRCSSRHQFVFLWSSHCEQHERQPGIAVRIKSALSWGWCDDDEDNMTECTCAQPCALLPAYHSCQWKLYYIDAKNYLWTKAAPSADRAEPQVWAFSVVAAGNWEQLHVHKK